MDQQEHKTRVAALFEQYQYWFIPERKGWGMYEIASIPGWFQIIDDLLADIKAALPPEKAESFRISQIKEKFGTLRFYYESQPIFVDNLGPNGPSSFRVETDDNSFEEIDDLISEATGRSAVTCIYCGDHGTIRTKGGWWLTLCPKCESLCRQEGMNLDSHWEQLTTPAKRN